MDLLATIIVILLALWVLDISFALSVGNLVHLLLAIIIIFVAISFVSKQQYINL